MKKIQKEIGVHLIKLSDSSDSLPIFIFDYLSMSKHLRYQLSEYTCKLCGLTPGSLDITWVKGQDELLRNKLPSFWFWDDNGLIPFAYIGKGAEKGPFNEHEGVLFLNTTNHTEFNEMPIVLLNVEEENVSLVPIADNFESLEIIKKTPNRELSEELKKEGNAFFGEGNLDAAANKFYEAIQTDVTNPNPYNNIGMITQITRKYLHRGEAFFQLAYLVAPEYTDGMRGYTSILANKGSFKKAIKIMKKCAKIEKSALNYAILSGFYIDNNDLENANKFYKKGLKVDENHPTLQQIAARL